MGLFGRSSGGEEQNNQVKKRLRNEKMVESSSLYILKIHFCPYFVLLKHHVLMFFWCHGFDQRAQWPFEMKHHIYHSPQMLRWLDDCSTEIIEELVTIVLRLFCFRYSI